jgi:hypothetical protein
MGAIDKLKFYKDRFVGEEAQTYVKQMMESWGYTVKEMPQGYHPEYDLFCTRVKDGKYTAFTIEVKFDRWYDKTGNLGLEHDGLDHSKADFLAICAGDPIKAVFLMPLPQIRTYAHQAKEYIRTIGERRDKKPNWATVVPESVLLNQPNVHKLYNPKYKPSPKQEKIEFSKSIPTGLTYINPPTQIL